MNANLDTSDGLKEDALNQVIACMEVQDATIVDCKKKFSARLELTDTKPAAAVLDKVLEESAWKKAGELIERKKNVGTMTKDEEKKSRDAVKNTLKKAGVAARKVELMMKLGSELKAIEEGCDAKKGKS